MKNKGTTFMIHNTKVCIKMDLCPPLLLSLSYQIVYEAKNPKELVIDFFDGKYCHAYIDGSEVRIKVHPDDTSPHAHRKNFCAALNDTLIFVEMELCPPSIFTEILRCVASNHPKKLTVLDYHDRHLCIDIDGVIFYYPFPRI